MKPHSQASFATGPPHVTYFRRTTVSRASPPESRDHEFRRVWTPKRRRITLSLRHSSRITAAGKSETDDGITVNSAERVKPTRRGVLVAPFLAVGASFLLSAATKAEENVTAPPPLTEMKAVADSTELIAEEQKKKVVEEEVITSRIYDATAIGEPLAIGKEKGKVWEKLMNARVVYLGEAEQVPVRDDKELELEIVKKLHKRCVEQEKRLSLALEAFPSNLQEQLNQFMDKKYAFEIAA